eukprot:1864652-Rhodomonas_salina.1
MMPGELRDDADGTARLLARTDEAVKDINFLKAPETLGAAIEDLIEGRLGDGEIDVAPVDAVVGLAHVDNIPVLGAAASELAGVHEDRVILGDYRPLPSRQNICPDFITRSIALASCMLKEILRLMAVDEHWFCVRNAIPVDLSVAEQQTHTSQPAAQQVSPTIPRKDVKNRPSHPNTPRLRQSVWEGARELLQLTEGERGGLGRCCNRHVRGLVLRAAAVAGGNFVRDRLGPMPPGLACPSTQIQGQGGS